MATEPKADADSPSKLRNSVDIIAAALDLNALSVTDGYDAFDADEDGKVSLDDLKSVIAQLSLNLVQDEIVKLYDHLGGKSKGYVTREEWGRVVSTGRGAKVLQSRGMVIEEDWEIIEGSGENGRDRAAMQNVHGESDRVQAFASMIAASLRFNNLDAEEGYAAFDVDEDGKLSLSDMMIAADALQLNTLQNDMKKLFKRIDVNDSGYIDRAGWSNMIANAFGVGEVVKEQPIQRSENSPSKSTTESDLSSRLRNSVDIIAAALNFNSLSVTDGYDAFDIDKEEKVSLDDLKSAIAQLSVGLTPDAVDELYDHLGGKRKGVVAREEWGRVLSGNGTEVLQPHGISGVPRRSTEENSQSAGMSVGSEARDGAAQSVGSGCSSRSKSVYFYRDGEAEGGGCED
jgi:Ca2+-binding EF-hand superfamily protein